MSTPNDRNPSDTTLSPGDTSSAELTQVVDDLLNQISTKFSSISSELLAKMDDMSRRLDNLETTIQESNKASGSGSGK